MAIVEGQKVTVKWSNTNRKYYESIYNEDGTNKYKYTKIKDSFLVDIEDITKGSKVEIKCECDYCGEEVEKQAYMAFKNQRHFCNAECKYGYQRKYGSFNNTRQKYKCDQCKKEIEVQQYVLKELEDEKRNNIFCSKACQAEWQSEHMNGVNNLRYNRIKKSCAYCFNEYEVAQNQKDRTKYCSVECRQLGSRNRVEKECANCEVKVYKTPTDIKKNKSGIYYCSHECHNEHKKKVHKEIRICECCLSEYEAKKTSTQRFCSIECQGKWQSEFLIGENANNYNHSVSKEDRMLKCDWCGNDAPIKSPYKLKQINEQDKKHFCSKECYREWYAKEWSQSEEWKLECKERAVKMLEDGVFDHTDTGCQIKINELLMELNVEYENEYNCKYVSIDNYLSEHNLMIEVMGTFWHSDHRIYKEINYQSRVDGVKKDKAKHTYILNNYGVEILYLWEEDIDNNIDLCRELIELYIKNNGKLDNYHSFNYKLDTHVTLKEEVETPYMEYPIEELKKIINIEESKKTSKKQHDKWIKFNCEQCGEEKEQLKSKYGKAKHHFCSVSCSSKFYTKNT